MQLKDVIITLEEFINLTEEQRTELKLKLSKIGDIETELTTLPALFSYYSGLVAKSKTVFDELEAKLERFGGILRKDIREEAKKTGVRATKDYMEEHVSRSEEYFHKRLEVLKAEEVYNVLKGLAESLRIKRDCLVQLSANSRSEAQLYSSS